MSERKRLEKRQPDTEEREEQAEVVGEGRAVLGEDAVDDGGRADREQGPQRLHRPEEAAAGGGGDGAGDDVVPGHAAEPVAEEEDGPTAASMSSRAWG